MSVRKSPPPPGPGVALTKRARVDDEEDDSRNMTLTVASSGEGQRKNALVRTIQRTSGLEAPIVSLGGAHGVRRSLTEGVQDGADVMCRERLRLVNSIHQVRHWRLVRSTGVYVSYRPLQTSLE